MDALLGLIPIALVALACPLMMIFMMRGMHGGHGGHADHAKAGAVCHDDQAGETPDAKLARLEREVAAMRGQLGARVSHDDEVLVPADGGAGEPHVIRVDRGNGHHHEAA